MKKAPPGSFRFAVIPAGMAPDDPRVEGATITCGRCNRVVGHFKPHELFAHAMAGVAYQCLHCDVEIGTS